MENNTHTVFNAAQLKMLNMMAMLKTKEEIDGLQQVVSDYLAKLLHGEIDRLWEEGELSEEKVESLELSMSAHTIISNNYDWSEH
ncbi:hypothetical protein [Leyella stercorea]